MVKKAFLVLSIFALAACSDGVYDEIDQQIEDGELPMTTNSFNNQDTGWINFNDPNFPFINPGRGYASPWDIWFRNHPFTPTYTFVNDGGGAHTSPFHVEVTCWVGLAYFDGSDDGSYDDPSLNPSGPPVQVADLTNGNYPNLYANNQEVGNLLRTQPIVLDGNNFDGSNLEIASDPANPFAGHLPGPMATLSPLAHNFYNQFFDVMGTNDEQILLAEYGKVFYFEVLILEKTTGAPVLGGPVFVQVANETVPGGSLPPYPEWTLVPGIQAPTPMGLRDIYYYLNSTLTTPGTVWGPPGSFPGYPQNGSVSNDPDYQCDSREVVFGKMPPVPHEIVFSYNGVNNWRVVTTMLIGSYLWQTSGPYVGVIPN